MNGNLDNTKRYSVVKQFPSLSKKFNFMAKLGESLYSYAERTPSLKGKCEEELMYKFVFFHMMLKAMKSLKAMYELLQLGCVEDAIIILRSIQEILINMLYIQKDPFQRSRLYAEYDFYVRWRRYELSKEIYPAESIAPPEDQPDALSILKREYDRIEKNYRRPYSWSGKSILDMARDVQRDKIYELTYAKHSDYVHSNPNSASRYVQEHGDGLIVDMDPKSEGDFIPEMVDACVHTVEIAKLFNQAFNAGFKNDIEELEKEFMEIFEVDKKKHQSNP